MADRPHPIQPLIRDEHGVIRFKPNAIVRWLLDKGPLSMNDIAVEQFSREDREQFAQLIGYSHSGAGDLDYVSEEVLDAADRMYRDNISELEARATSLQETLNSLKEKFREGVIELYGKDLLDL